MAGRSASVDSSSTRSTNIKLTSKSVRTRLWQRLRKLDRQITELDNGMYSWLQTRKEQEKRVQKRIRLDQKRKDVRAKLKGYQT